MRELRRIADKMRLQEHMKKLVRYFYVQYLFVQQEAHITVVLSSDTDSLMQKGLSPILGALSWHYRKYESGCWSHD